jgi:homogentisate 1,2-dioxygenase
VTAGHFGHITRDGFRGDVATLRRHQYTPRVTRIEGAYQPRLYRTESVDGEGGPLPVTLLREEAGGVAVEVLRTDRGHAQALRNVWADELHVVIAGQARIETDLGILRVGPGDAYAVARGVSVRVGAVSGVLHEIIVATPDRWLTPIEGRGPEVQRPEPWPDTAPRSGEFEVVLRHGAQTTSYFYDEDPLPSEAVSGAALVRKVHLGAPSHGIVPPLFADPSGRIIVHNHSGSGGGGRPPIHQSADQDELHIQVGGSVPRGGLSEPGSFVHVPKGVAHHGPAPEAGQRIGLLIETSAALVPTAAGLAASRLAETSEWQVHPSEAALARE